MAVATRLDHLGAAKRRRYLVALLVDAVDASAAVRANKPMAKQSGVVSVQWVAVEWAWMAARQQVVTFAAAASSAAHPRLNLLWSREKARIGLMAMHLALGRQPAHNGAALAEQPQQLLPVRCHLQALRVADEDETGARARAQYVEPLLGVGLAKEADASLWIGADEAGDDDLGLLALHGLLFATGEEQLIDFSHVALAQPSLLTERFFQRPQLAQVGREHDQVFELVALSQYKPYNLHRQAHLVFVALAELLQRPSGGRGVLAPSVFQLAMIDKENVLGEAEHVGSAVHAGAVAQLRVSHLARDTRDLWPHAVLELECAATGAAEDEPLKERAI
eukprot:6210378-Pleurochrysis_carterae.AAC.8